MGVPVLETWTAQNSGTVATSLVLTKPSGVVSTDLLVFIVGSSDSTSDNQFADDVTGWSLLDESGNSSSDAHIAVYWRYADGTEAATTTVNHATSDYLIGWYLRISGAGDQPPLFVFDESSGNSSSHVIPSITTTADDNLAIYGLMFDGGDGLPFGTPAGWTEIDEEQISTAASTLSGVFGTKSHATAGATGTATVTSSVSDGAAYFQLTVDSVLIAKTYRATRALPDVLVSESAARATRLGVHALVSESEVRATRTGVHVLYLTAGAAGGGGCDGLGDDLGDYLGDCLGDCL